MIAMAALLLMSLVILASGHPPEQGSGSPRFKRQSYPSCESAAATCVEHFPDLTKYPNIASGFRGFNIILGGLGIEDSRHGKAGLIFDEAKERSGAIRFNNIAGEEHSSCKSTLSVEVMKTLEELMSSVVSTDTSSSSSQWGREVKLKGHLGASVDANANLGANINANIGAGFFMKIFADADINGQGNGKAGLNANLGAGGSVEFDIPPLYQALASNNKHTQDLSVSMDSKQVSVTKSWTQCERYSYQLQPNSPPVFHSSFKAGLAKLGQCWNTTQDYNCAKEFFTNFGTHYVTRATFGAKAVTSRVLDYSKANSMDKSNIEQCTRDQTTWSVLGSYTRGSGNANCQADLSAGMNIEESGLRKEKTFTVGCKPSPEADWNSNKEYPPEIVEKTLAPLSDLFVTSYMSKENIDYENIGPWLQEKLLQYCGLFKDEHHCNHVLRRPFCPECGSLGQCGKYTGNVDKEFRPHGRGTLTFLSPNEGFITGEWTAGCPAKNIKVTGLPFCPPQGHQIYPCMKGTYKGNVDVNLLPIGRGTVSIIEPSPMEYTVYGNGLDQHVETDSFTLDGGDLGTWRTIEKCTYPHFATKMELKVEEPHCSDKDDTTLNAIRLTCSDGTTITSGQGWWGVWRGVHSCFPGSFINGAQIRREKDGGYWVDDTAANGMRFDCTNGEKHYPGEGFFGTWGPHLSCQNGSAIIGIQTQVEEPLVVPFVLEGLLDTIDVTALNDVKFICAKL